MPHAKQIQRLIIYRRALANLLAAGELYVSSEQLGRVAGCSADLVRRDFLRVPSSGVPRRGYAIKDLLLGLNKVLQPVPDDPVAIVGMGNLGRAILSYLSHRHSRLHVAAVFDSSSRKIGRVYNRVCCQDAAQIREAVAEAGIRVAIITVPADAAPAVAEELAAGGVRAMVNFAPIWLNVPETVHVQNMDIMVGLEMASFYSHHTRYPGAKGS